MSKVDVLAVMDRLIGNTRTMAGLTGDPRMREHLAEGEQARAAIAELLELVESIMPNDYRRGVAEIYFGKEWTRLSALLAKIHGPTA